MKTTAIPGLRALKVAARYQRAAEVTLADLRSLADEFEVELNLPADGQGFSWDDNDSLADELLDDDSSMTMEDLPRVVLARHRVASGVRLELDKFLAAIKSYIEDLQQDSQERDARKGRDPGDFYTVEQAERDIKMWQGEARESFKRVADSVEGAMRGVANWAGSNVTVVPLLGREGPIDWYGDEPKVRVGAEVYVHKSAWNSSKPSFTAFTDETGNIRAVDDVLDAGDGDFFSDPAEEADYFSLTEELRNPGRARSQANKVLTLYTARPKKDRALYDGTKHVPTNVFLTTDPEEAHGYAIDLGGDRDVYRLRVKRMYLVETLDRGRLKNYQTFSGQSSVPVESCDLISEGETRTARRVLAKYQEKKKVPKANGKGTTEVYVYSEGQVNKRNRDKAKRLQKFKPKVEKLRAKVKADLGSKDRETRLVALAVALIDETHERVGNDESAKGERNDSGEPHYGVTGWKKRHITLGSGSATIRYVGKSGVKHEKTVSTPHVLSALRQAHKEAEGKDGCLFAGDDVSVTAAKVNEFLEPFGISAKDLRGLAANSLMQKALKKARKGKLPGDKTKRTEQLKQEFKEALEAVSDELGHEASTLKSQYLAPNMESEYLKDGTIIEKLDD